MIARQLALIAAGCLIVVHAPDGDPLLINIESVVAVRSAKNFKEHLAHGTHAVIYADAQKFGVTETQEQINALIERCGER